MNTSMSRQAQGGSLKSLLSLLLVLYAFIQEVDCLWNTIACKVTECCDSPYIHLNMNKLRENNKRLYGQHLALGIIEFYLEAHFDNSHTPSKPLVFSFHGGTGTGKNYVTNFIIESIYSKGMKSKYVHYYHVSKQFPHARKSEEYSKLLQTAIEKAVYQCERSIFVFDEFDHMPPGVIDTIKVYLDFHESIEGVDYRKSTFIFLTNSGDELINNFAMEFHTRGGQREKIQLSQLEHHLARNAQTTHGGFQNSQLIEKHLVTAYVPFLPLLQKHVKMCIVDELSKRGRFRSESWIQEILNELHFVKGFSESGCKRVREKVGYIITKHHKFHKEL